MGERLLLDLRLHLEGAGAARGIADHDLVTVDGPGRLGIGQADLQPQFRLLAAAALTGPQGRDQAALPGQILGQGVGRRRLQQLERAVEVGLADAVGPDEYVEPRHRIGDRLQGPVAPGPELSDGERHAISPSARSMTGGQWAVKNE